MADELPRPEPGAKMMYLIRRRPEVSRDELIVHWFANHMPGVIHAQAQAAATGRPHAWRYMATLFEAGPQEEPAPWDGVAQLWWDRPLPQPSGPFGTRPRDSFQERAEPYHGWATAEYVLLDGSEHLPVVPLTLNPPFPTTRSGFHKMTWLVAARRGTDFPAFYRHWLTVHAPKVARALADGGGFRYLVSLSLQPEQAPYAGMAEVYCHHAGASARLREIAQWDDMSRWVDPDRSAFCAGTTEMIGIP